MVYAKSITQSGCFFGHAEQGKRTLLGGFSPFVSPRDVFVREEEDRLESGKDEETSQLPIQGHFAVVGFTCVGCEHTAVCPKARHTEKINPANQELIWLGDTCWQSSRTGCPGKTCLKCRNVHMMCRNARCPERHTG